jgi:beta-glucosidase
MKKLYLLLLLPFLLQELTLAQSATELPYKNPDLPTSERVNDLIRRMSLEEKVSQMMYNSPGLEQLDIPAYNWWNEALHGVGRSGLATIFPQAIGMGATFDEELLKRVSSTISDEARAMHNAAAEQDYRLRYSGLTFWTPNINIFRDPRWGRGQETYGEDPFLTGRLGVAFVQGLQGDHPKYLKTAACAKHFAVHSGPERLRHEFDAVANAKDLHETYLPAFKALVDNGVEAVMCAYNSTNGEPCCANNHLLQDILRDQWNFQGHIVSDCWALVDLYEGHKVAQNEVEAAAMALKSGVNLNCGSVYPNLVEAVQQGLVSEEEIDERLATLLKTRFALGMFDPVEMNPYNNISIEVVNSKEHRQLARETAQKSVVMLKNEGVLPLKNNLPFYYITGPNASSIEALIGNYYGVNNQMVTMLEGIAGAIAPGSQLQYKPGIMLDRPNINPIDWTTPDAKEADATIVVLGITGLLEGEEGESIASPDYGDRLNYNLPENQLEFLRTLREGNEKPIIALVTGGSPMNLSKVHELSDAVLLIWYPGQEGGNAVADIIFGKASPSGKLPITFPKSLDQLPPYEDYNMEGRTYRYMKEEPMYPFGFGLSYAQFEYSAPQLSSRRIRKNQSAEVEVTLSNTGAQAAEEVVQLYISDVKASVAVPLYALKGFKRISLEPGESQTVAFTISPDMLELINDNGERVLEKGDFKIYIGGSSPGNRSRQLGAPQPAEIMLTVW